MAHLVIMSEEGMFHAAVLAQHDVPRLPEWYGFKPKQHRAPSSEGLVDRSNRSGYVNHYIRFEVPSLDLDHACEKVPREYEYAWYEVLNNGGKNCVKFAADFARTAGLMLPQDLPAALSPFGLIQYLKEYNRFTEYDDKPFPF